MRWLRVFPRFLPPAFLVLIALIFHGCTTTQILTTRLPQEESAHVGSGQAGLAGLGAKEPEIQVLKSPSGLSQRHMLGAQRSTTPAIPGSLPSPNEEIWVIARDEEFARESAPDEPGCGAMLTETEQGKKVPLPLKHTDVKAGVLGYIATVHVTQQFHNPFDAKIEATYVFPLPHNAAVNEFIMQIGQRRIRGIIRERQEAERIYEAAKRQGYVASLLTQERPNVFTQSVANIEPGKAIDVELTYFNTLAWVDGWYEFVFPTVVGPRFNPPGSTEGVGAVARGKHGVSGQKTEVPYLKPGERSGHDIALELDLNAGVSIERTECTSHVVETRRVSDGRMVVALSPNDRIPNKDFVFRYRVAGERIKSDRADAARQARGILHADALSARRSGRPAAQAPGDGVRARLLREHARAPDHARPRRRSNAPCASSSRRTPSSSSVSRTMPVSWVPNPFRPRRRMCKGRWITSPGWKARAAP